MRTELDCLPCFVRQSLEAVRMVSRDPKVHRVLLRKVLRWISKMDLSQPPPVIGQRIHRQLRCISGNRDPYLKAKHRQNELAMRLLPKLRARLRRSADPLDSALRLAIAGNIIDMGINGQVEWKKVIQSIDRSLSEPLSYDRRKFKEKTDCARSILYLADNAGEIIFDRLLIEQLSPNKVTLAVRGGPVINDATLEDARQAGLIGLCRVVDNGSDAPGTILEDCGREFRQEFRQADLVIAKGQGNFETLNQARKDIIFLFQAKCPVVAGKVGRPVGSRLCLFSGKGRAA